MKKLNNKGFTLVEVLAVVVILSVLTAILIPSVNYLITMNEENSYEELKDGLIQATKVLLSDYRYEVSIVQTTSCSTAGVEEIDIELIGDYKLKDKDKYLGVSKVPIKILVAENNVSVNESGDIVNPKNKKEILNLDESYVLVTYQCATKDFKYQIKDEYLKWQLKN